MRNARTSRSGLSSVVRLWVLCGVAVVVSVCLAADKPAGPPAPASAPGPGSLVPGPSSSPAPGSPPGASSPLPVASSQPFDANDPDVKLLVKGLNEFAIDLYKEIAKTEKGNIFFSPLSIGNAFGMTYMGARGETATEMAKVFRFAGITEKDGHLRVAKALGKLSCALVPPGDKVREFDLRMANALWVDRYFPLLDQFTRLNRDFFRAKVEALDLRRAPSEATKTINKWVEGQTDSRIRDLIAPQLITGETVLVLTNAVFFKGTWAAPFKPEKTVEGDFWDPKSRKARAKFMRQNVELPWGQDSGFSVVDMPYRPGRLSMLIALPDRKDGLEEVRGKLTGDSLSRCVSDLSATQVDISFPKFVLTCESRLDKPLRALGMPRAFSPNADFSGISSGGGLSISFAVHKADLEVDEVGTVAAAATAVGINVGEPKDFRADHPFIFLIRDRSTGLILFLGQVVEP